MTTINFNLNGNIIASGDISLSAKRSYSFDGTIDLKIISGEKLMLRTAYNTLNPLSIPKIIHQELTHLVALSYNGKIFEWGNCWLKISHNPLDIISKRLCTVYLNDEKLLDVRRKKLTLSLETKEMDSDLALYTVLFLMISYCNIDGSD